MTRSTARATTASGEPSLVRLAMLMLWSLGGVASRAASHRLSTPQSEDRRRTRAAADALVGIGGA